MERRLDLAPSLLSATDLPVSQVAFRSGFLNVTRFNGRLRRRFGRSPSAHRQGAGPTPTEFRETALEGCVAA